MSGELSDTEVFDPDPEEIGVDGQDDLLPDEWELYQRMAESGRDLAVDLKRFLQKKDYAEAYQLIAGEHALVVQHVIGELWFEVSEMELKEIIDGLIYVCFKRIDEIQDRTERKVITEALRTFLGDFNRIASKYIQSGVGHKTRSKIGTDRLMAETERKHRSLLSKAAALKRLNPRLSRTRIADLLIGKGETHYSRSNILIILKKSDRSDDVLY